MAHCMAPLTAEAPEGLFPSADRRFSPLPELPHVTTVNTSLHGVQVAVIVEFEGHVAYIICLCGKQMTAETGTVRWVCEPVCTSRHKQMLL